MIWFLIGIFAICKTLVAAFRLADMFPDYQTWIMVVAGAISASWMFAAEWIAKDFET